MEFSHKLNSLHRRASTIHSDFVSLCRKPLSEKNSDAWRWEQNRNFQRHATSTIRAAAHLALFAASDRLLKGVALDAVQIAERLLP